MRPLWKHDGVLEYESLDGFTIRAERRGKVMSVTARRDGREASITITLGPNHAPDHYLRLDQLEAIAVGSWKTGANLAAVKHGLPRPFPLSEDQPRNRRMKRGRRKGEG